MTEVVKYTNEQIIIARYLKMAMIFETLKDPLTELLSLINLSAEERELFRQTVKEFADGTKEKDSDEEKSDDEKEIYAPV